MAGNPDTNTGSSTSNAGTSKSGGPLAPQNRAPLIALIADLSYIDPYGAQACTVAAYKQNKEAVMDAYGLGSRSKAALLSGKQDDIMAAIQAELFGVTPNW